MTYSKFNKILFFSMLGLLIFIPLYPKFPLANVSGTFVAIRWEDILIGVVVGGWFIGNIHRLRFLLSQTIVQAFLLFWFVGLLSVFSGIFVTHTVEPHLGILHWFRRVEYMSLFLVAATLIRNIGWVKLAIKVILLTGVVVIAYGFGQIFLNFPVVSTNNSEFSKGTILYLTQGARVNSTFAGHYDLAIYLSIVLMLAAGLFFDRRSFFYKLKLLAVGVSGFVLLGLTAARVSFVATLVGLSLAFWISKKRLLVIGLIVITMALLVGIPELRHRLVATITVNLLGGGGPKYSPPPGTVTVFTPAGSIPKDQRTQVLEKAKKESTDPARPSATVSADTVPGEPINTTELGVFRSYGIRLDVEWPRAINSFLKNPFLGTGYSSISLATDNDYLRSLGETGFLGTLCLGAIFFAWVKKMIKFLQVSEHFEKYFTISMISILVTLGITETFIDGLEASKIAEVFWLLAGISWAVITKYKLSSYEKD